MDASLMAGRKHVLDLLITTALTGTLKDRYAVAGIMASWPTVLVDALFASDHWILSDLALFATHAGAHPAPPFIEDEGNGWEMSSGDYGDGNEEARLRSKYASALLLSYHPRETKGLIIALATLLLPMDACWQTWQNYDDATRQAACDHLMERTAPSQESTPATETTRRAIPQPTLSWN